LDDSSQVSQTYHKSALSSRATAVLGGIVGRPPLVLTYSLSSTRALAIAEAAERGFDFAVEDIEAVSPAANGQDELSDLELEVVSAGSAVHSGKHVN